MMPYVLPLQDEEQLPWKRPGVQVLEGIESLSDSHRGIEDERMRREFYGEVRISFGEKNR